MTKSNDNWPLVTHSRREPAIALTRRERDAVLALIADDSEPNKALKRAAERYLQDRCPVCPHPAHSGRCRVMVEVYAGETSCGCPENDS